MGKPASPRCHSRCHCHLSLLASILLEPAVGREDVGFAVAVDVGDADAVAVLLAVAEVVDAGLVLTEVDPEDAGVVVVGEGEVGFAVAVDVGEGAAFGVEAVGDLFGLPHGAGGGGFGTGVAIPPEAVGDPAGGDEIGQAVVVDVDDPLAAVVDEFVVDADGAELMLLPLSALGAGVLVPVGSAENDRGSRRCSCRGGRCLRRGRCRDDERERRCEWSRRGRCLVAAYGTRWRAQGPGHGGNCKRETVRRAELILSSRQTPVRRCDKDEQRQKYKYRGFSLRGSESELQTFSSAFVLRLLRCARPASWSRDSSGRCCRARR